MATFVTLNCSWRWVWWMSDEFKISDSNRSSLAGQTMAGTEVTEGDWSPWPLVTFFIGARIVLQCIGDRGDLSSYFSFHRLLLHWSALNAALTRDSHFENPSLSSSSSSLPLSSWRRRRWWWWWMSIVRGIVDKGWKEREALCATRLDTRVNRVNNIWVNIENISTGPDSPIIRPDLIFVSTINWVNDIWVNICIWLDTSLVLDFIHVSTESTTNSIENISVFRSFGAAVHS